MQDQQNFENKRKFKRADVDLIVECFMGADDSIELDIEVVDISAGGMKAITPRQLVPESYVLLVFYLPNEETQIKIDEMLKKKSIVVRDETFAKDKFEVKAEVVWSKPSATKEGEYDTGLNFVFLNDITRTMIDSFVELRDGGEV